MKSLRPELIPAPLRKPQSDRLLGARLDLEGEAVDPDHPDLLARLQRGGSTGVLDLAVIIALAMRLADHIK